MKEGIRQKLKQRRLLPVFLSIAIFLSFMPAVPDLGIGAENSYGAEGTILKEGIYNGLHYSIIEKTDGTYKLELGSETTDTLDTGVEPYNPQPRTEDYTDPAGREEAAAERKANRDKWPWLSNGRDEIITSIEIIGPVKIKGHLRYIFAGMPNLTTIVGFDKVDTSEVTGFENLFTYNTMAENGTTYINNGCPNLESVDGIEEWDISNAVVMHDMFGGIGKIKELNLSKYETAKPSKLKDTQGLFVRCSSLEKVTFGDKFDTSNSIEFGYMFSQCPKLSEIVGLNKLDTSSSVSFVNMFYGCEGLTSLDLATFKTGKAEFMTSMFYNCKNLQTLDLSGFDTGNVLSTNRMFFGCSKLESIYGLEGFNTSNVTDMERMFINCKLLESDAPINFIVDNVAKANNMLKGANKIADAIEAKIAEKSAELESEGKTADQIAADPIIVALKSAKEVAADAAANDKRDEEAMATLKTIAEAGAFVRADEDIKVAEDAVANAQAKEQAAADAKAAADADPTNEAKATAAKKAAQEAAQAMEDAQKAVDKAKASADKLPSSGNSLKDAAKAQEDALATVANTQKTRATDDLNKDVAAAKNMDTSGKSAATVKALNDAITNAETVLNNPDSTAADINAAQKALDDAKAALEDKSAAEQAYSDAKAAADALAKSKPGSDEAIKAAEDAYAKATDWQKAAEAVLEEAKKSGDADRITAAEAQKAEADKAKADASSLVAEQKTKKAENLANSNPGSDEAKKAADEAKKAAEQAVADNTAAYGPNAPQTQAAQNTLAAANAAAQKAGTIVDGVGTKFIAGKNQYEISQTPGATWDGAVTLITAKNAKNVSVPKTVTYNGKKYEVNRIGAKAFRAKKIRKVTLGANIEKLDKNAFKKSKATTIVVKTKSLTKKSVKGSLKGSKVKTVQVKVGSKKVNKKFVKKYKKIFTKKNAGKKVTVK